MKKNPFFSIIVATFNSEKTVETCLDSICDQTFKNWEIVLIDGDSSDNTLKKIKKYQNKIAFISSEKDRGIYDAMNKGVKNSNGKFIFFLNSDDQFFDNKVLEDVFNFISSKKKEVSILTANVMKIYPRFSILKNNKLSLKNLKKSIMPPHQSMFVNTKLFHEIGGFNSSLKSSGDFDFCCKLLFNGANTLYFDRITAKFHSGGMSSNKNIAYFETFRIIKKYFGNYYSFLYFFKKIILEQNFKKILLFLKLNNFVNFLTMLSMKNLKEKK